MYDENYEFNEGITEEGASVSYEEREHMLVITTICT